MVVVLAALLGAALALIVTLTADLFDERRKRRTEEARVTDLLNRLAARSVAEYQAWASTATPPAPAEDEEWLFDPTGLMGVTDGE